VRRGFSILKEKELRGAGKWGSRRIGEAVCAERYIGTERNMAATQRDYEEEK
jgi:hypothetical protein